MTEEIVISNENKIKVGKLIRIYQKENGITLFDLVESVCSRQVATNFNKGIPAKNDDHYLGTLAKLGFSYNYMHNMDDYILKQCKRLKDAVEWYDKKRMEEICLETIERLKPYSKYIIEYEYLRAFKAIYKFHFIDIKIEDETNHFLETMEFLNEDIIELLKNIIFKYCYKYYGFIEGSKYYEKSNAVFMKLNISNTIYSVNKLNYAVYLLSLKYHFDCFRVISEVEYEYIKTGNFNGLLLVYTRMFWLIGNIQEKSLDKYENRFNQIVKLKESHMDRELIMQGLINLATNYFEMEDYVKAKKYFLETINCDKAYVKSAICLMFIQSRDKTDINFKIRPLNECSLITERERKFYEYYLNKLKGDNFIKLLEYIDTYILSCIGSKNSFYYLIFERELKGLQNSISTSNINCRRKLIKVIDKFRKIK